MMYRDVVKIKRKPDGSDPWAGGSSGDQPEAFRARVTFATQRVIGENGQEVTSSVHIRMPGIVSVGYGDEVTFTEPAGTEKTKKIISYKVPRNLEGQFMMTVVHL
ncbi:hypothetical protein MKX40_10620 [Paenibacillus sp. FSL R5-0517]|uniref:hypothetical protein n=1 Tax=unclassified Paenibacillus TaxID=185978 RepID=UPI0030CB5E52